MSAGTTVVVLIAARPGSGDTSPAGSSKWPPGVFVGNPNPRIRDRLWVVLAERIHDGQAVMIEPAATEQGWSARTAGCDRWTFFLSAFAVLGDPASRAYYDKKIAQG